MRALVATLLLAIAGLSGCVTTIQEQLDLAGTNGQSVSIDTTGAEEGWTDLVVEAALSARVNDTWLLVQRENFTVVAAGEPGTVELGPIPEGAESLALTLFRIEGTTADGENVSHVFDPPQRFVFTNPDGGITLTPQSWVALANGTVRFNATADGETITVTMPQPTNGDAPVADTRQPVARMSIFAPGGALEYQADFLAVDGEIVGTKSGPFFQGGNVTLSSVQSEALEPGTELATSEWELENETYEGSTVDAPLPAPGVYHVKLTVTDSLGVQDTQEALLVVAQIMSQVAVAWDYEDGGQDWEASGGFAGTDAAGWSHGPVGSGNQGWKVGLPSPVSSVQGYLPASEATLASPGVTVPDWPLLGYEIDLRGRSEGGGFDELVLQIQRAGADEWTSLETFGNTDWTTVVAFGALGGYAGDEVAFRFLFYSDEIAETPIGWELDALRIVGSDAAVINPDLWADAPTGEV